MWQVFRLLFWLCELCCSDLTIIINSSECGQSIGWQDGVRCCDWMCGLLRLRDFHYLPAIHGQEVVVVFVVCFGWFLYVSVDGYSIRYVKRVSKKNKFDKVCSFNDIENSSWIVFIAMFGRFGISSVYSIVTLHTAELFPTEIRGSALGACSTMAHVGSMAAPFVVDFLVIYFDYSISIP